MLADWSAECSSDDPVLVVPWSDPEHPERRFVDLREDPYELESLPEAEQYLPLRNALRSLNAPRSPVFTAKCDAWPVEDPAELQRLQAEFGAGLDADPGLLAAAFSSYIDLLWRDRSLFASRHQHEHLADRLTRRASALDEPQSLLEVVIRPALQDLTTPQEGFALTMYVHAAGSDVAHAERNWAGALGAVTLLLRSRDLVPSV